MNPDILAYFEPMLPNDYEFRNHREANQVNLDHINERILPINLLQRHGVEHPFRRAQLPNEPQILPDLIPVRKSFEEKIVVELLKSNDPDDRKQLNLIVADIARTSKQRLCNLLLSNGYEVDVLNEKNQTMLHIAFHNNSQSIIITIMDSPSFNNRSIDYADSSGLTHLHIACAYGNAELTERYLKTGSDVNAVYQFDMASESSNFTPLHFAVSRKNIQIVKLLLGYGANVNLTNLKGQTPLHLACCYDHTDASSTIIIKNLIANRNVNINARDNQGNTPLLTLFCYVDPYELEFKIQEIERRFDALMEAGADFVISNKEGDTVLHLLIKNLRFSYKLLSFSSMSFNDTNFVRLMKKILYANIRIVNLKNKLGQTPLQLAVAYLSLDAVKLLLEYDVFLNDLKINHFCYPNVVPIFEPVQNLLSIVVLLSERRYTLSPEDSIHILTFLIHESCDCKCLTYDSASLKAKFNLILNFGSSRHIIDTLSRRLENEDAARDRNKYVSILQCYVDLTNTGKFYVDKEVKRFLEEQVSFCSIYTGDQRYEKRKHTELKQLESVIKNEMKLYDIMLKNPHDVSRLINNIDFSYTFADTFSLYKDIVKGHITKALIRSYVENSTYEVLKQKLFSSLPDLCCDIIIRLLSNLDILHMYVAAHPPMMSG